MSNPHPLKRVSKLYRPEVVDKLCELLVAGLSLNEISKRDGMPSVPLVHTWLADERKREFWAKYSEARNKQADTLVDSVIELARTPMVGTKVTRKMLLDENYHPVRDANGEIVFTREEVSADMIEHRRLQIDTIKWYAGKVRPKKYGDRTQLEITGSGGGPVRMTAVDPVAAAAEYARIMGAESNEGEG